MEEEERMVLDHEPVPGYRKIFYVVLLVGVLYLGLIFMWSFL